MEASQGILGVLTWQPKIDGWKMTFPFGAQPIFRGELLVSGRVTKNMKPKFCHDYATFFLTTNFVYTTNFTLYLRKGGGHTLLLRNSLGSTH